MQILDLILMPQNANDIDLYFQRLDHQHSYVTSFVVETAAFRLRAGESCQPVRVPGSGDSEYSRCKDSGAARGPSFMDLSQFFWHKGKPTW